MTYTIKNKKNIFILVYLFRIIQAIYAIIFLYNIVIFAPVLIIRDNEILLGISWILIIIIFGIPGMLLLEYGIRNLSYKEAIIHEDRIILLKRNKKKKIEIPFNTIYKREVDGEGSIHYYTNLDFKPHPLYKKGTLSSNYLDDRIIEIIDKNIDEELIK